MLPSIATFQGKRKLKFKPQKMPILLFKRRGGWMGILCSNGSRQQFFSILEKKELFYVPIPFLDTKEEFMEAAKVNSVHVMIIPGGCTSKA